MLRGLEEQEAMPNISKLNFNERFELLLDREEMVRRNKSLQNRIRKAKFKESACIEDIDYDQARGINKTTILKFASAD
jgi:DNA replication protein DnaC